MNTHEQELEANPIAAEGADALRRRAERRARQERDPWRSDRDPPPLDEVRRIVHELRVHQIELEIQNEELLRVQGELTESRERYVALYDLAPVAYLTLSEEGRIVEANLTAADLLGEERDALLDQPFTRFVSPSDQDTWYLRRRRLFESEAPERLELEVRRADGTTLPGLLDIALSRDTEGKTVIRAVVSDISERKREELERRRLEQRLQQAEKAESLARMAAAMSHRFNNLLGVTMGNLELALDDLPSDSGSAKALADALTATREAADLGRHLLTYLGQARGEEAVQDLSEICRRALPLLRASMPSRIELEVELPPSGPPVRLISGQIQRVLTSVITNAWEAADEGRGSVRLEVSTVPPGEIRTDACFPVGWTPRDEPYCRLAVTDDGGGIEEALVGQIFDPFFSTKAFGRGLGLSVALGIVRAHAGAMGVRRRPGGGTTVDIYLPPPTEAAPELREGEDQDSSGP